MIWFEHHYGDHFETPETEERSEYYNVTYHPHTRFDGSHYLAGAPTCVTATNNYRTAIQDRLDATGGQSPVEITGDYLLSPGQATVTATFRLQDPATLIEPRASILIYEDNIFWCCGSFGIDTWPRVTRTIYDQRIDLANPGDEVVVHAEIPLDPSWNPEELHFVAYLQDVQTKEIFQGSVLGATTTSIAGGTAAHARASIAGLAPNPFRSEVRIQLAVPPDSPSARLEILDPRGRVVARPGDMLAPGLHELRWDGSEAGVALGSGVYFVRLVQGGASTTSKLVLTR